MIFYFFNIKFSSSFFKRFNCFFKRCNFAFASRISFRTRNRSLCILRMMKEEMTKSQNWLDATHARHFSNASSSKHCLFAKKQDLQRRMLTNKNSKFEKKDCFRWENVRLLNFARGIFHTFETKVWKGDSMLRVKGDESILRVHDFVVTRILLEVLGKRTSMSRDQHVRHARGSNMMSMKCSICSRIEQGEHNEIYRVYRSRTRRSFSIVFNSS